MLWRRLSSPLRQFWIFLQWRLLPNLAAAFVRRNPTQAVFAWPEQMAALGPRVALFVHFDGAGNVRPYVVEYLRQLQAAGLSVLFVSNAGKLRPAAIESIRPICAGIVVRRNIGYDFAAMREGLVHFGLPRADTEMLVIANDSVYGPLCPLDELLGHIDFDKADFWGATESWQSRYHLQSFFMVAGPRLLAHPAWAKFWRNVRSVPNKRWVITRYEVGITQWMIRAGLRCAAIWPYHDLLRDIDPQMLIGGAVNEPEQIDPLMSARRMQARRVRHGFVHRIAMNPTSDMWRQLIRARFPFFKRELLRDNPTNVHDVMDWREAVRETFDADVSLIERDLQRLVRNAAP